MMMLYAWFPLLLLMFASPSECQRSSYCLASDYDPYQMYGTKTAYEFVKGRENSQNTAFGCQPLLFWSFNRHGTRLPGQMTIQELPKLSKIRDDIISNYEIKRTAPDQGRLCESDLDNLKNWMWNRNFTANIASDLTSQGYDDLKYLAKRWQGRFSNLLPPQYNRNHYLMLHTNKRRTRDSYRAFADGLFGREAINGINPQEAMSNSSILMLKEDCLNKIKDDPINREQVDAFKRKQEYKDMILNVSNHLGYRYELDDAVIKNIYDMCRYDKAWDLHKNSPWCAAFNKDQLKLLEYVEDLKYYYELGYGNKAKKRHGCGPLKDMIDRFTKMIEHPDQDQQRAVIYVTHSQMFLPLLTALGIAEDNVPLLADNYHTPNIERRMWRTSRMNPFAANLVAVLHKCQNEGGNYKIMFLLNEQPVDFKECRVGLCSWETIKSKYADIIKNCNTDTCFENAANTLAHHKWHIIFASVVTIIFSKFTNI